MYNTAREIIEDCLTQEFVQYRNVPKELVVDALYANPLVNILFDKKSKTVFIVVTKRDVLGEVMLMSKGNTVWDILKGIKRIQKYIKDNMTYKKLEMRTALSGVGAMAKRLGWSEEGIRRKSYLTDTGILEDEVEYGLQL